MIPRTNGNYETCIQKTETSCKNAPSVKFMLTHLKRLGCEISLENKKLLCEPCNSKILGGFDPDKKEVILCENNLSSQQQYNQILTHELIHAFDICRIKYDTTNLKHLACSEIRAANLSGDCSFKNEFSSNFRLKAHQQICVKRKAVESIICVKSITKTQAEIIVESVFKDCFNDYSPFNKIP